MFHRWHGDGARFAGVLFAGALVIYACLLVCYALVAGDLFGVAPVICVWRAVGWYTVLVCGVLFADTLCAGGW